MDRRRISAAGIWAWLTERKWRIGTAVGLLGLALGYPFAGGAIAGRLATAKLEARLHTPVRLHHARAGLLAVTFHHLEIGPPGDTSGSPEGAAAGDAAKARAGAPLFHVNRVRVPFAALLFRRGLIELDGVAVNVR